MGNVLKADSASGLPWPDARAPGEVRDLGVQVGDLDVIERADLGFILQWADTGVAGGS